MHTRGEDFCKIFGVGAGVVIVDEKYYFCMRAMRACGIAFVISAISGMTKRLYYAKKYSFIGRIYRYKATL